MKEDIKLFHLIVEVLIMGSWTCKIAYTMYLYKCFVTAIGHILGVFETGTQTEQKKKKGRIFQLSFHIPTYGPQARIEKRGEENYISGAE